MLQTLINRIVFGMDPQAAVEAPRFATYSFPDSFEPHSMQPGRLVLEARLPQALADELAAVGHDVQWAPGRRRSAAVYVCVGVVMGGAQLVAGPWAR